jgi:hypothetical protein
LSKSWPLEFIFPAEAASFLFAVFLWNLVRVEVVGFTILVLSIVLIRKLNFVGHEIALEV